MVSLDGPDHLRRRRLLLPSFHGERLRAYEVTIGEAVDREVSSWPVGSPFALPQSMRSLTMGVMGRVVFGDRDWERRGAEIERRIRAIVTQSTARLGRLAELPRMLAEWGVGNGRSSVDHDLRGIDELLREAIASRRRAGGLEDRDDVLATLLTATDQHGEGLSDGAVRDELFGLMVAGHETTAGALAVAFDLLLANPPAAARLRAELGSGDGEYLDAVIRGPAAALAAR